jgi:hypothetical protein
MSTESNMCPKQVNSFVIICIEERVFKSIGAHKPSRSFDIDGYIEMNSVSEDSFFFNSKFESGNLRQAFKVP